MRSIVEIILGIIIMIYVCISFVNTVKVDKLLREIEKMKADEETRRRIEERRAQSLEHIDNNSVNLFPEPRNRRANRNNIL